MIQLVLIIPHITAIEPYKRSLSAMFDPTSELVPTSKTFAAFSIDSNIASWLEGICNGMYFSLFYEIWNFLPDELEINKSDFRTSIFKISFSERPQLTYASLSNYNQIYISVVVISTIFQTNKSCETKVWSLATMSNLRISELISVFATGKISSKNFTVTRPFFVISEISIVGRPATI